MALNATTLKRERCVEHAQQVTTAMEEFAMSDEIFAMTCHVKIHFNAFRPMSRRSSVANLAPRDIIVKTELIASTSTSATR